MLVDIGQEIAETRGTDLMVALKKAVDSPGWDTDTVFPLLDSVHLKLATCSVVKTESAQLPQAVLSIIQLYLTGYIPVMTTCDRNEIV